MILLHNTLMSRSYSSIISSTMVQKSGQNVPRAGHEKLMIKNSAGGYTYGISDEDLIDRILILGTNGNTYYSSAEKLTGDSVDEIKRMVSDSKGNMILEHLKNIYESGRAPKQDPTFFVLALLTQNSVPVEVRKSALDIVSNIRVLTHLYMWEGLRKQLADGKKGFGRAVRNALKTLVQSRTGEQFAYQATKYHSRKVGTENWSIDDIIKCAHIPSKELNPDSALVIVYLIKGMEEAENKYKELVDNPSCTKVMEYLRAVEAVKSETCTTDTAIQLVRQYRLPREVLNTKLLSDANIWMSLLFTTSVSEGGKITRKVTMPITALIRNLGVMSARGLFDDSDVSQIVSDHLTNQKVLRAGRVHPVALLLAKLTYDKGHGLKGKLSWSVNKKISDALEEGFYIAFGNSEGTGLRIFHGVDCSGSMTTATCAVPHITACQAVSTLVMEAIRREHKLSEEKGTPYVQDVMLFNYDGTFVDIKPNHKLSDVMKLVQRHNFGTTDCAQPMIKALQKFRASGGKSGLYDLFIVYTDNETFYGNKHPSEALDEYREATGINARMVVIATTPTNNSIGYGGKTILDTSDKRNNTQLALNIVGFDLNAPELIRNFACNGGVGMSADSGSVQDDDFELVEEEN